MTVTENNIVGQVVAENYKTASVFKKHKIDFCCKGDKSIAQACEQKSVDKDLLLKQLNESVNQKNEVTPNFKEWDLDLLVDYIEKTHHRYVRTKIPEVREYLKKVASVHSEHNPELIEIEKLFLLASDELEKHLLKEERILFPYIRQLVEKQDNKQPAELPPFGTVQNPIEMMKYEHDREGEWFAEIAGLSNDYTPPEYACNSYRVAYALLQEFENDLHRHIHLENNILFPSAIELEKTLNA